MVAAGDETLAALGRLVDIVRRLRAPNGCPWDRAQTHRSLRRFVLEEAYEVVEAIDEGDPNHLAEELGDLLLQVLLHAQIAAESGRFTLADVARALADKLVRRHPHVFGRVTVTSPGEVQRVWRESKRAEREASSPSSESPGEGQQDRTVPAVPSALVWAYRVQERAEETGNPKPSPEQVWSQLVQELQGLEAAVVGGHAHHIETALGRVLFGLVGVARQWDVYPEAALLKAVRQFRQSQSRPGGGWGR